MMTTEHPLGMVFSIGGTREDRQRIYLDNHSRTERLMGVPVKNPTPLVQSGKREVARFLSPQKFFNFFRSASAGSFLRPFLVLMAVLFCSSSLQSSPGPAWHETTISMSLSNRMAEVTVPVGAKRIAVEVMNSKGEWVRWAENSHS
jgi:hypothetical protein